MQLFTTPIVTLFLLSLQVMAKHTRMIRRRPGNHHPGSGLGGGIIFPFPPESDSTSSRPTVVASSSASTTTSTSLSLDYLTLHNSFRKQYSANPLVWSADLASAAQQWASNCHWGHSTMSYGENIAAGTGGNFTARDAFNMWTSEAPQYNATDPLPSHFTQVVWKATTHVGCAMTNCTGLLGGSEVAQYFVCEYEPAGNVIGNFTHNVQ
ncbi:hypothetical protein Clacol_001371 [Clathrus columnatus]|uniref:SCP domain-containing protein n=1 Tax=Clathrus columnatus TaxID=1419009 RepID=A0AAV4ZY42_9AGAM|nr:hypothetical protein Clacol_001371 [Clathrus columnatus]